MAIDYRHLCTAAMVTHCDLATANEALVAGPATDEMQVVLIRHIMLELATVSEIGSAAKPFFKDDRELGEAFSDLKKPLEFFKYVRNKYVGHFQPELTAKIFEWQPIAYKFVGSSERGHQAILSWFALEVVVNTYTDTASNHHIFDSDTDFRCEPNRIRFFNYLGETVQGALAFLSKLIEVSRVHIDVPDLQRDVLDLAQKAADTQFDHLSKGKR